MRARIAMHGRDHCPGGADPIPCLTGPEWAWLAASSSQTIATSNLIIVKWDEFVTTDADGLIFEMVGGRGSTTLTVKAPGVYVVQTKALAENTTAVKDVAVSLIGTVCSMWDPNHWLTPANWNTTIGPNGIGTWALMDILATAIPKPASGAVSKTIQVRADNFDLVNTHDVEECYLHVLYWPLTKKSVEIFGP